MFQVILLRQMFNYFHIIPSEKLDYAKFVVVVVVVVTAGLCFCKPVSLAHHIPRSMIWT
jgi:hypothetical protein